MTFTPAETSVPVSIQRLQVILVNEDDGDGGYNRSARFILRVLYSDDDVKSLSGDLVPHITPQQASALVAFMDTLRAQAEEQILPA